MKRLLHKAIVLALMAVSWVGCVQDEVIAYYDTAQESDSAIHISLNMSIPDPILVGSRAVTEGIDDFTVLCFDKDDKALTKVPATITATTGTESGTLTVKIPNATRVMHVFANQNTVPFYKGMSEYADELKNLVATADKMVYWGRIEVPAGITTSSALKNWWTNGPKSISLLRSHAKVEVKDNTDEFELKGFTVVNTKASGMAIPYKEVGNVYPTVEDWSNANYIHAATEGGLVSPTTLKQSGPIYVYETPVNSDAPASIIICGSNNTSDAVKYWRVEFVDNDGKPYDIRRNHHFTVNIEGKILEENKQKVFAYDKLEDALTGNPIGIIPEIDPEVTAIKIKNFFSLTVENTSYVMADAGEETTRSFHFTIEQLGGTSFDAGKLKVKWDDETDQTVSDKEVTCVLEKTEGNAFTYTVTADIKPLEAGNERQEGTIVINYDGRLERKVKMIVIPQQTFELVSYNDVNACTVDKDGNLVYEVSGNRVDYDPEKYTIDGVAIDILKFKLPATFPAQLLPLNVLVSTTDFNVWDSPLIFQGAGWYGDKNIGPGYKYVCRVDATGTEYEIKLRYVNNEVSDMRKLTLEAANFEPVKLIINYTTTK